MKKTDIFDPPQRRGFEADVAFDVHHWNQCCEGVQDLAIYPSRSTAFVSTLYSYQNIIGDKDHL